MTATYDLNIPIPAPKSGSLAKDRNPLVRMLRDMPVNGSRFEAVSMVDMQNAICVVRYRYGGKFTTRKVVENDINGIRVWRLEASTGPVERRSRRKDQ